MLIIPTMLGLVWDCLLDIIDCFGHSDNKCQVYEIHTLNKPTYPHPDHRTNKSTYP